MSGWGDGVLGLIILSYLCAAIGDLFGMFWAHLFLLCVIVGVLNGIREAM